MGKSNQNRDTKSAAKAAAEQQAAPQVKKPEAAEGKVIAPSTKANKGLTQGEKVQYLASLQKEREFIMNQNEQAPVSLIDGLSILAQSTILDIAVGEIATGTSALGLIISRNPNNYLAFSAMAKERGVNLPDFKSLPAPTKEQLEQAGLSGVDANQAALVVIDNKNVSKEAKDKKKKEKAIENKKPLDPSKIENEAELKDQLTRCFLTSEAPVLRVQKAIDFYNSYLTIQAKDSEEELKKVKAMTRTELLRKVTEIVGECTFAMCGIAHFLNKAANETKGPVAPFCLYRRASNSAGERATADDSFIADMVKILIIWACNSKIAEYRHMIATNKRNIEKLGSDKAAVMTEKAAMKANESEIVGLEGIIKCVSEPTFDVADNLEADYDAEEGSSKHTIAHRLVSNIIDTYYKGTDPKSVTKESLLKVAKYHIGTIINMFADPLSRSIVYKDMQKPELVKVEEKPEEESKN